MKLTSVLSLAFAVLVAATPAPELARRDVNCEDCNTRFKFCVDVSCPQ